MKKSIGAKKRKFRLVDCSAEEIKSWSENFKNAVLRGDLSLSTHRKRSTANNENGRFVVYSLKDDLWSACRVGKGYQPVVWRAIRDVLSADHEIFIVAVDGGSGFIITQHGTYLAEREGVRAVRTARETARHATRVGEAAKPVTTAADGAEVLLRNGIASLPLPRHMLDGK